MNAVPVGLAEGDVVAVIDDNQEGGKAIGYSLSDAGFSPMVVTPEKRIDAFLEKISNQSKAAICDHRLGQASNVSYTGAEFVAKANRRGLPTVLITSYADADAAKIRRWRSNIPCLLRRHPDSDDPDILKDALQAAREEIDGTFKRERQRFRTVIRVERVISSPDGNLAEVVVSAWKPNEVLQVPLQVINHSKRLVSKSDADVRLIADVNIYAGSSSDLFFENVQSATPPPDEWRVR